MAIGRSARFVRGVGAAALVALLLLLLLSPIRDAAAASSSAAPSSRAMRPPPLNAATTLTYTDGEVGFDVDVGWVDLVGSRAMRCC